ncbi:transposase [Hydrogenobacter thermophilus]|uniref:RNA-guided endonuclease InsQ/TnpB family protein n=1 Tax=Hydrogenobacter thermophilus TaxID=940 RepID=UPI0030FA99C6
MHRAIQVSCPLTKRKKDIIKKLLIEYRKTAKAIAGYQWFLFFNTGSFNRKANIKHIRSNLSERYKYTIQYHVVVPVLESFISNIKNRFSEIVKNSNLPEKTKRVLLYLNKNNEWLIKKSEKAVYVEYKNKTVFEYDITEEERLLAKKIFKHILSSWRKPKFKKVSLILDSKTALIEEPEKATHFDRWIRLSTLEKGKPIYLPVKFHDYFEKRRGKITNLVQIEEDGTLRIVKEIEPKRIEGEEIIALDFGLRNFLSSSKGDLFGRKLYEKVKEYAEKIDRLQRNLQRQGIKPAESKRFVRLTEKLSAFIKNEIRRIINRIVKLYNPKVIVIENLKSLYKKFLLEYPKAVKKVVARYGYGELKKKLQEIREEYGIEVIEVNPAYSSQTCSSCGYVDKENRKTQEKFECRLCGYKASADVNGAKNLISRAYRVSSPNLHSIGKALVRQVDRFLKNLSDERYECLRSKALGLLSENPYFRGFSGTALNPMHR